MDCHRAQVENWRQSHHAKAMLPATADNMLGNFNNTSFESDDGWTLFNQDRNGYYIETGKIGEAGTRYRVPYVLGFSPLQQVLVDIGKGRFQAYTVAWDSRSIQQGGQRWFSLYEQTHTAGSPFYWLGTFNNWNARCAQCHSTKLSREYDVETDSYNSRWKEINVACEACHGPASKHLQLKKAAKTGVNSGFDIRLDRRSTWIFKQGMSTAIHTGSVISSVDKGQIDQCAACHSRRTALTDGADAGDYSQHYIPRIAVPGLYHGDGQILDEVYVYGSFSQSKMAAAGVVCSNCHQPHSGKLLLPGNQLCGQCHRLNIFDAPEHTLHKVGSSGPGCIDCHMPSKRYMGVDDRRDHAYRVPNPWVSELLGSPDVCLTCHKDNDSQWSQQQLKEKKEQVFADHSDIGSAVVLNRLAPQKGQSLIARLVLDEQQPPMRRAVLLSQLDLNIADNIQVLNSAASDTQSLVKLGVLRVLNSAPYPLQLQIGFGLLYDDNKNVRLQAIRLLAPAFRHSVPEKALQQMQLVLTEALVTYQKQQDLLSAQSALADMAYKVGALEQAQLYYINALKLQPSFLPAKLNLASIYRETGQLEKAKTLLEEILVIEENHAMALHNLGLIYVIDGQWPKAIAALKRAADVEPENSRFAFVYVLSLEASGEINMALDEVKKLERVTPGDPALAELTSRLLQGK